MKERDKKTPDIVERINENFRQASPTEPVTVEWLAEQVGIGQKMLYRWIENDPVFAQELEIFLQTAENPAFKLGDDQDQPINEMLLSVLFIERMNKLAKQN